MLQCSVDAPVDNPPPYLAQLGFIKMALTGMEESLEKALWVFGYGSIIWKVDFPFEARCTASILGWGRRFWQGSIDHRGIPGQPGRVVTLIERPDEICWGMAYRLPAGNNSDILDHLDHRERGGYDRLDIDIYLINEQPVKGITWFACENNPNYLGEASPHTIARQIIGSKGPSGENIEYIYRLEESLSSINVSDPHVTQIANEVRALQK